MFSERNYNYNRKKNWKTGHYAVPSIILINILIFLLQQASMSGNGYTPYGSITFSMALIPVLVVKQFQFWRLFTYMFLHGGFWHLALNMWGVYLFGSMLEQYMGSKKFLFLYLVSGLFAGIFWTLFNFNSIIPCIGASGALFGVLVASAMLFPNVMIMLLIPPIPLKLKTFAIVYALIETFSAFLGLDANVAHLAHIGGLIAGYVIIRFLYPNQTYDIFKPLKAHLKINTSFKTNYTPQAPRSGKVIDFSSKNLDTILDKISKSGINSLSQEEIAILKQARENMRNKK